MYWLHECSSMRAPGCHSRLRYSIHLVLGYDPVMARVEINLTGMPYVPGVATGILQRGMCADPAGRVVLLKQPLAGPLPDPPAGYIMIEGAPLAHAMIPLLGSGVPTVIVTHAQAALLEEGTEVLLDGTTGHITTRQAVAAASTVSTSTRPVHTTADGVRVELRVSARDPLAVAQAAAAGAGAIGLVRSEFLAPGDGRLPDAAFYERAFRTLCTAAAPLPVTVRLIDIAADKHPGWLPEHAGPDGTLGLQGVRLYDKEPLQTIYRAQLAAIDALADAFDLRVLLPYVSDRDELLRWHAEVRECMDHTVPVGAMAETPAACLQIGSWLEVADFVSIGCNDLMQCLFGADRDRPELRPYLDPHAPPLFRFLQQVAADAQGQLARVQLCGVLPQLPGILPVLLGLGFRVFSVEPAMLPFLWQRIANTSIDNARTLADKVCAAQDAGAVRELLAPVAGGPDETR